VLLSSRGSVTAVIMGNQQPEHQGKAAVSPHGSWCNAEPERIHVRWLHRFVARLSRRLPDEPAHRILAATDEWAHHFDEMEPEEAAEITAMWPH
jgi:hypothetical protein